jgi:hypothetical protein
MFFNHFIETIIKKKLYIPFIYMNRNFKINLGLKPNQRNGNFEYAFPNFSNLLTNPKTIDYDKAFSPKL